MGNEFGFEINSRYCINNYFKQPKHNLTMFRGLNIKYMPQNLIILLTIYIVILQELFQNVRIEKDPNTIRKLY